MNTFGSLLKDHPDVLKQSKLYPILNTSFWWNNDNQVYKNLPIKFDGRDEWGTYLQFPSKQNSSSSWSIVATDILADRYCLSTAGQINLFLSSTEVVACIEVPPHQKIDNVLSGQSLDYKDSTQGYSIYDAWEYLYDNGVSETNCFSKKKLESQNIPIPSKLTFNKKLKVYGENCSIIEGKLLFCITKKDDKPIARRTFYNNAIINISGNTLDETIRDIKYEILRFGPVAGGFLIYENFINDYDGKTVYEKVSGKPLGGHYISIVGWDNDHWICRNSYGVEWGLLGYFKMKMGIKECMLESNISSCAPFYHSLLKKQYIKDGFYQDKRVDVTDMKLFNPELEKKRNIFNIDPYNFYPKETIKLIKEGKLYGDLDPLISNPNDLPNEIYYWAKDFRNFKFINEEFIHQNKDFKFYYFFIFILCILCFYFGYR
jgi:hypothetical protein